jgi:hypothetical protein
MNLVRALKSWRSVVVAAVCARVVAGTPTPANGI